MTYLISARTRSKPLVCEVELLHAEWTDLLFVIVDELIVLTLRHDWRRKGETRVEEMRRGRGCAPGNCCAVVEARVGRSSLEGMEGKVDDASCRGGDAMPQNDDRREREKERQVM